MDFGFVTHAVHANSRMVYLRYTLSHDGKTLLVVGPPDGGVYPPGPAFLHIVVDSVPSEGVKIIVGSGASPPVDPAAHEKCASCLGES